MCWCAEVSAGFGAAEWAGITWLVRRNKPFDRGFALAISPIAAQEVLQWLLWEHISTSVGACDRVNLVASFLIRQVTGLVPLGWVWFAQRSAPQLRWGRWLLGVTTAFVAIRAAMMTHSYFWGPVRCTTIGPHHHQAWAGYLGWYESIQPGLDYVSFTLYWMLPVGSLLLMFRPKWLAITICAVVVGTMVPCIFWYTPEELGSVWCWTCSLLMVIALGYPTIQKRVEGQG
jgi:hypothetical protein